MCGKRAGFTFIELLVVVVVILVLTSAITPMFRSSLVGMRIETLERNLMSTMRYAGEQAVLEGRAFRLYIDTEQQAYWVERAGAIEDGEPAFEALPGAEGDIRRLPGSIRFDKPKARKGKERDQYYISFYPGGSSDFAEVRLETTDGEELTLKLEGAPGRIELEYE
jgi:prepilin-type N-terminal cleavage/methylation domain-containing protein